MNEKALTPRLMMVASLVPECQTCADIGCDHAQVAIWLARQCKVDRIIASDVNEGPLSRAKSAVHAANLEDRINCVQTNGLDGIEPQDCVIIAGMGGDLIADILSRAEWTKSGERTLILQPMTAAYRLREFLLKNGYSIVKETYAAEKEKLYAIICAKPGMQECRDISELYISRAGEEDTNGCEYAKRIVRKLECELQGLLQAEAPNPKDIEHRRLAISLLKNRFKI